jgi:hypothetical protein
MVAAHKGTKLLWRRTGLRLDQKAPEATLLLRGRPAAMPTTWS